MAANDVAESAMGTVEPRTGVTYAGPDVGVTMNRHHLLRVIDRLQRKPEGPSIGDVAIPFAMFLGLLTALIPMYQDQSQISPFWRAFTVLLAIATAIATVVLFVWWVVMKCTQDKQTPDEVVDDILDQIAKDQQ